MSVYLNEIKKAARISHNKLDDHLGFLEDSAREELIRAGLPKEKTALTTGVIENNLVKHCIITGVLADIAADKDYDRLHESFLYQIDNLRKHKWED